MSKKTDAEVRRQKKIDDGIRAEALLGDPNWAVMKEYIAHNTMFIDKLLRGGLSPDIEYGIITKTVDQKYHEYVGKGKVLADIERYLNKLVEKKNKLLSEENGNDSEVHGESSTA